MWQFIVFFFIIQLINVILSTFRTIVTARGNKIIATVSSAIYFGFYSFVIVYTANDFNIWVKAGITVLTNLIGVWISMTVLEKMRKDRLWEVVATIEDVHKADIIQLRLNKHNISYNYGTAHGKKDINYVFHIYCSTQKESAIVKEILISNNAKYIVHEENAKL